MKVEVKIPAVGESITEATIASWLKNSGDYVEQGQTLLSLETDKANVDVVAEQSGTLEIKEKAGSTLAIGSTIGLIDTEGKSTQIAKPAQVDIPPPPRSEAPKPTMAATTASNASPAANGVKTEIKIPVVGESITEGTIAAWHKRHGDYVERNENLLSLETDKATVDIVAENSGVLEISKEAGAIVPIGSVVGWLKPGVAKNTVVGTNTVRNEKNPTPVSIPKSNQEMPLSPAVRRIVGEYHLDAAQISGSGKAGRITKLDAEQARQTAPRAPMEAPPRAPTKSLQGPTSLIGKQHRTKLTTIRKRIAERLVMAQQTAAILTTFNEINMSAVVALRAKYKDSFKERYGVGLGFLGLFTKACIEGLRAHPEVNAFIEDDEIVYNDTFNVGIAVSGPKGLLVPVLHHVESMSLAEIELKIKEYGEKARAGKITIEDLSGGTFTISNGGTYGSLLSTPILNPPQSGILGMHKIEDRPIAVAGKVEIHPMMYVALSYDHRIIDGEGAVKFLVKVKESLEDPNRILLEI